MLYIKISKEVSLVDVEWLKNRPLKLKIGLNTIPLKYEPRMSLWDFQSELLKIECYMIVDTHIVRKLLLNSDSSLSPIEILVLCGPCTFTNMKGGSLGSTNTDNWELRSDLANYKILILNSFLTLPPIKEDVIFYKGTPV